MPPFPTRGAKGQQLYQHHIREGWIGKSRPSFHCLMVLIGPSIHLSCLLGEEQRGPLPHPQEVRKLCLSHRTKHTGLPSTGCYSDAGISRQGLCGESRDWRCPRLPLAASQEPLFAFTTPSVPRPTSASDLNQEPHWYEFGLRSAQMHKERSSEE